ncbi:MAG: zinc ABC transporter substrate-binding protein [Verrucomicrobiota bacterium]
MSQKNNAKRGYPYTIVTTCGMVTNIVSEVAGGKAQVIGLMGEGVDPHLYKPTRDDVAKLLEADIVFYSGLMLEGRMTDTFVKIARKGTPVHAVTEEISESYLLTPEDMEGHPDPHVWMDVQAWSQATAAVAQALSQFDPENAPYYQKNLILYQAELEKLDAYIKDVIASIPQKQRYLITAHDAFGYFARSYGIEVKAAQGLSTESEAGVADINGLVDFIVEQKIKAIFVETSVADKNIQAIIEGAKSKGHEVTIGGALFSDAMGEPGTYEGTYIGMLDSNATTIARALGGNAPAKGLLGQLSKPKQNPSNQES